MQKEINAAPAKVAIQIVGVNQDQHQSGSPAFTMNRDLPWLDEGPMDQVWQAWNVSYRDVVILDDENRTVAVYNLTVNDLSDPAKYAELKTLLLSIGNAQ